MLNNNSSDKPAKRVNIIRVSHVLHTVYNVALPVVLLFMVRGGLTGLAVAVVLLSKWRVFAVRPRFWLVNVRANAIDLIFKLSTIGFIIQSQTWPAQVAWTAWYVMWLIFIKPGSTTAMVSLQALIGQFLGLSALFLWGNQLGLTPFVLIGGVIGYSTARHFFSNYEEPLARLMAALWGLFVGELVWLQWHWALTYFIVPQISIFTLILSYTLGNLYHQSKEGKLKRSTVRDQLLVTGAVLTALIVFSDWHGGL